MGDFLAEYGFALLWVAVIAATAIAEAETCDLVAIWFIPGALTAMILAFCGVEPWVQVVVFIALSAAILTLFFTVLKKRIPKREKEKTKSDALIGARGIVEDEIDNIHETGSVKIRGLVWSARSANDAVKIPVGSLVTIKEIVGVKLICEPEEKA